MFLSRHVFTATLRLTPRGLLRGQKPLSQAPNVGPRSINTERNAGRGPRPSQPPARGPASPPPGAASPEQERGNREGREGNAFFLFQFFTQIFLPSPPSLICVKEKNTEGSNDDLTVPTAAWAATGSGGENRRGSRPSPWRPRVSLWRPGAGDHSSEDGARGDRAGACGRARTLESSSSAGRRENGETRTPRGLLEPGQGTPGATCALSTGAPPGRTEIDFQEASSLAHMLSCVRTLLENQRGTKAVDLYTPLSTTTGLGGVGRVRDAGAAGLDAGLGFG